MYLAVDIKSTAPFGVCTCAVTIRVRICLLMTNRTSIHSAPARARLGVRMESRPYLQRCAEHALNFGPRNKKGSVCVWGGWSSRPRPSLLLRKLGPLEQNTDKKQPWLFARAGHTCVMSSSSYEPMLNNCETNTHSDSRCVFSLPLHTCVCIMLLVRVNASLIGRHDVSVIGRACRCRGAQPGPH
jgi:hypothetical protein